MMSVKTLATLLFVFTVTATNASAREYRFFGYHLPAPPAKGSDVDRQDFTELHQYQDERTPAECAIAQTESHLTLEDAFGPSTGVLTAAEVKKVKFLSFRIIAKAAIAVLYYKTKFKRPRPYNEDSTLVPCVQKPGPHDMAYPSGHATTGYALALALAKKFPAKSDLIMKQGLQIGNNRLLGGVHHPSDVAAGRALAVQVVNHMAI